MSPFRLVLYGEHDVLDTVTNRDYLPRAGELLFYLGKYYVVINIFHDLDTSNHPAVIIQDYDDYTRERGRSKLRK